MCVSLFSGCALHPVPGRVPMATIDLNHFQIDCGRKEQQVVMLQSMRQTRDENFAARMRAMAQPLSWNENHDIAYSNPNKYINHHLRQLSYCP